MKNKVKLLLVAVAVVASMAVYKAVWDKKYPKEKDD